MLEDPKISEKEPGIALQKQFGMIKTKKQQKNEKHYLKHRYAKGKICFRNIEYKNMYVQLRLDSLDHFESIHTAKKKYQTN